jgi:hypothetical protein
MTHLFSRTSNMQNKGFHKVRSPQGDRFDVMFFWVDGDRKPRFTFRYHLN